MILVIGGLGAGKRRFVAAELGYGDEDMADGMLDHRPVLLNLHTMKPLPDLTQLGKKAVVVCNEVGCGIVPIDPEERAHREAVGRLCCALAQEAQAVYRVSCGLPMRLK